MKQYINTDKLYCNEVEVISLVEVKIKAIDKYDNETYHTIKLELYDYQDIQKGIDIVLDCSERVENTLEATKWEINEYLKGKHEINYHNTINEILDQLPLEEEEYMKIEMLEVSDIKFKVKEFEIISE